MIKALIIDDNSSNILVLQQLLSLEQIGSDAISSPGNLARQLNALHDFDVVFLDLEMPGINGYEAAAIIKQHPNFAKTKVIAYSVHVSEINVTHELGFDGFLGKPINAEAFPDQLRRILRGEKVFYTP